MKQKAVIVFLSAAVCLASHAQAQMGGGPGGGMGSIDPGGDQPLTGSVELPPEPEARAEDLRLNGKCDQAIPILRRLAAKGPGYGISQYNLGLCLYDLADAEPDAKRAANLQHEAAEYIVEAANNGFPGAQKRLVTIYLDGTGIASDPVEAGKWSLLYHANGTRQALGLPDISSDVQARLDSALTQKNWDEAQSRAASWSPPPGLDAGN
ncbi:MAG: hypothetical protein ACLQUZ_07415 [Rhizomicrobium sp.]